MKYMYGAAVRKIIIIFFCPACTFETAETGTNVPQLPVLVGV